MVEVRIFYQTDPAGTIPGGVDTFIRGIVTAAPDDIRISVVGLTTDPAARPVGRWSTCVLGKRTAEFFPVGRLRDPRGRSRIPLSLQLTAGIARHYRACAQGCDVLEFHRVEPAMAFLLDRRPKNAFVHQNMADALQNSRSDVRWKALPGLFFRIERMALRSMDSVFGVRSDAIDAYKARYPELAERFRFIATWMDPELFYPAAEPQRARLRDGERTLISVGRLDAQKNPLLLVDGFALLARERPEVKLVVVGDGVLRKEMEARVERHGIAGRVVFAGLRPPGEVAELLRQSHCFVLSSAYEGMPMSVLEALGCGIPVVSTRVGEVERVVRPGINGEIVSQATPAAFAQALESCLAREYPPQACVAAVADYVPAKVLQPVYEQYRRLARNAPLRRALPGGLQCKKR